MPILFLRAVAMAAALLFALLPALAAAAPLSLDQALDLAVQRSEAARAARATVASASETARAAGQLPDPMLRAGIENLPITGSDRLGSTADSQTMKRIGISQEWLSADKRAARQAAADAAVGRQSIQTQAAIAQTRLQTALAYADAYFAGEALKLALQAEHHVHEELEASRVRLASSAGSSVDTLALTAQRGLAEDERAEAQQLQSTARLSLQRWVGLPAEELSQASWPDLPSEESFVAAAPSVVSARQDIEVARRSAAVAASERKPNWTWEVSYGQRTGYADMVSFGVSIPLQLAPAERQDRETAAKLALVDKAEAELAEATRAATADYRGFASDAQRLQQRIDRYRSGVVTPAQQRTAAAMAAYASNQASLAGVFEARHAEVELLRKLLDLQRDLARAQAHLAFEPLPVGAPQ